MREERDPVLQDAERAQDRAVNAPENERDDRDHEYRAEDVEEEHGREVQEPGAELRDEHGIELADAERHAEEQREHDGRYRDAEVFQVFLLHGWAS